MTSVTPLHSQETVAGGLRNALQIARMGCDGYFGSPTRYPVAGFADAQQAFGDIARLLKNVLEALSEPNLPAMQAGEILLKEWLGTPEPQRQLRDTIQGILHAQVTGIVPKTWKVL